VRIYSLNNRGQTTMGGHATLGVRRRANNPPASNFHVAEL
jgi:hypothetical protein